MTMLNSSIDISLQNFLKFNFEDQNTDYLAIVKDGTINSLEILSSDQKDLKNRQIQSSLEKIVEFITEHQNLWILNNEIDQAKLKNQLECLSRKVIHYNNQTQMKTKQIVYSNPVKIANEPLKIHNQVDLKKENKRGIQSLLPLSLQPKPSTQTGSEVSSSQKAELETKENEKGIQSLLPLSLHPKPLTQTGSEVSSSQKAELEINQANIHECMQYIASHYYGKPYPPYNKIIVLYQGKKVFWEKLTSQQKYDVLKEHALSHEHTFEKKTGESDEEWQNFLDDRLLQHGNKNGKPVIMDGMKADPRQHHGKDHCIRVSLFAPVFLYLYKKYHPDVTCSKEDIVLMQLTGAYHDSGRQTDGIDVDDGRSANNAAKDLSKWNFPTQYIDHVKNAIINKNDQDLTSKHLFAKCLQCADSMDYGRMAPFNQKYLDIYKDFHGVSLAGWKVDHKKPKFGTIEDFNKELTNLCKEMQRLIDATSSPDIRKIISQEKNYYSNILEKIDLVGYPKLAPLFIDMGIIQL